MSFSQVKNLHTVIFERVFCFMKNPLILIELSLKQYSQKVTTFQLKH